MKYLICCLAFKYFTGSELYVYDLTRELKRRGHEVTIIAGLVGDPLLSRLEGVPVLELTSHTPSLPEHDIVLAQHHPVATSVLGATDRPVVYTVHSEMIEEERPIIDDKVYRYIAVRQEIADHMVGLLGMDAGRIEVVPNGIDLDRFRPGTGKGEYVFVPGALNTLRQPMVDWLLREVSEPMLFMGMNTERVAGHPGVIAIPQTWGMEVFYDRSLWVAGLFKGRTGTAWSRYTKRR
jgi:glycosyltransferase involved in cell wall biosynthesis